MLSFKRLRDQNMKRCQRWHDKPWSLSDWGVAVAGELGEALNVIKKLNRERDGLVGNSQTADELKAQLAEEIADTLIYLDILAAHAGVDLDAAVIAKFNAVSERVGFPESL